MLDILICLWYILCKACFTFICRRCDVKNKIAVLRKERGLTQQALAEELKVSRQTVISLENGRYNPSIRLAFDIAQVFGCIIEEVFLFEEDEI